MRDPDITLIEPREEHHYQPGYTLVAAGDFSPQEVLASTRGLGPGEVPWVQDRVKEVAPDRCEVWTEQAGKIPYDFLVLVPGCQINFREFPRWAISPDSLPVRPERLCANRLQWRSTTSSP